MNCSRIQLIVVLMACVCTGVAQGQESAIEERLTARAQLIADQPDDPRLPIWLADQATDLYFELLSVDASGLATLFGSATSEQRARAERVAQEMHRLAGDASAAMAQAVATLEASPTFPSDDAAQSLRRQLIETERERRIPFLLGVGAFLHAELNVVDEAERVEMYKSADRILEKLVDELAGRPGIHARIALGLARARLGDAERAAFVFRQVIEDHSATEAEAFAARMGGVMSHVWNGGPQAGLAALEAIETEYVGKESGLFLLLMADQHFRLRRMLAQQAQEKDRDQLMMQAYSAYTNLLQMNAGIPREQVQAIVLSRLAGAIDDELTLHDRPAILTIARADQLARSEATREDAILVLEGVLSEQRLSGSEQTMALFLLARALYQHGQHLFAARRYIELAREHPQHWQAERAIELGVSIAADLYRRTPHDPEARATLDEGLEVLLERYPGLPSIDRWRFEAGLLALDSDRFDDAAASFAAVTPDADEWLDAQYMLATAAKRQQDSGDETARRHAAERLLAVCERVVPIIEYGLKKEAIEWRRSELREYLASLRVFRAEAFLSVNQPEKAIDTLRGIEPGAGASGAVLGRALTVRIKARQSMGQPEEAQQEAERFLTASPELVREVLGAALNALSRDVHMLADAGREEEARRSAVHTLLPLAELLAGHSETLSTEPGEGIEFGRSLAEAFRLAGRFGRSLEWYDRLLEQEPAALELLLGRAECLFHLGGEERLAEAISVYKRLAAAVEPESSTYWLCQLRMLQILDQADRRTEQIVPRVERLRLRDPELGGERYQSAFLALRQKYAR